jgi:hypothetical protein
VSSKKSTLMDLMEVDKTDEKLYTMVRNAQAIAKAARIAKYATQERIDAEKAFNAAKLREHSAVQDLSALILETQ